MCSTFGCCAAEAYQGRGLAVELAGAVILALAGQLRPQEAPIVAASIILLSGGVDMLAILQATMTFLADATPAAGLLVLWVQSNTACSRHGRTGSHAP